MRGLGKDTLLPLVAAITGSLLLAWWFSTATQGEIDYRLPGQDGVPPQAAGSGSDERTVAGNPVAGTGTPSEIAGRWPGFRGADRLAVVRDTVPLARSWPEAGPEVLWSVELGEGYASPAIADGCVYVLDYDEQAGADTLRCLSLDDGREIWRNGYPVAVTRNHGMSRTVPVIVDDRVITFGPRCHVACWDAKTGACHWLIDLVRDHGATEPRWYAGQCPLIDGDRLLLAPCGDALMMAVDYRTGEVVWECPNPRRWEMSHVSITPMDFQGQRSYVYCGSGGVAGVSTEGDLLWDSPDWPMTFATCPSPVILPEGRIFLCSGYARDVGSLMLQVERQEESWSVRPEFTLRPDQFNSEHHTPILFAGHLYGVRKRGGGQLVCLDLQGQELWNSGADRFGHGPYLIVNDVLLVMDDKGVLTMAAATDAGYQRLARHEIFPDGHDAWGPMAIVEGRLIVRDMTRMACLNIATR